MNPEMRSHSIPLLAVVIPAWRSRFLADALRSLQVQTDRRFRVYIGDDASPDDLRPIVAAAGMDVLYHRFTQNLGGVDLIAHWHRCIALTQGEPWIWVFADDDLAEPECVEGFYRAVKSPENASVQLFRFNFKVIDAVGRHVSSPAPHPGREEGGVFLRSLLSGNGREVRVPDHIFARKVFEANGGFVWMPQALYADPATWIEYAVPGGVVTLGPAELQWRAHGDGVSSGQRSHNRRILIRGLMKFLLWSEDFLKRHPSFDTPQARQVFFRFFIWELRCLSGGLSWTEIGQLAGFSWRAWPRQRVVRTSILLIHGLWSRLRCRPLFARWVSWRYQRRMAVVRATGEMPGIS